MRQFNALGRLVRKRFAEAKTAYRKNDLLCTMHALRELKAAQAVLNADITLSEVQAKRLEDKMNKLKG